MQNRSEVGLLCAAASDSSDITVHSLLKCRGKGNVRSTSFSKYPQIAYIVDSLSPIIMGVLMLAIMGPQAKARAGFDGRDVRMPRARGHWLPRSSSPLSMRTFNAPHFVIAILHGAYAQWRSGSTRGCHTRAIYDTAYLGSINDSRLLLFITLPNVSRSGQDRFPLGQVSSRPR
jgi:hypothetical protein